MEMVSDIVLQIALFLLGVTMFLFIHGVPQKALAYIRRPKKSKTEAKREFVVGAQLLTQARSFNSRSIAESAAQAAHRSILLDPSDAASHILKSLALDFQGFKTSALDSMEVALSPLAVKSLSQGERGEALVKRAELKLSMDRSGQVDSALSDLKEASKVIENKESVGKLFCVMGDCYEIKEMTKEARDSYSQALMAEPDSTVARQALARLPES